MSEIENQPENVTDGDAPPGNIPRCFFPYSSFYIVEDTGSGINSRFAEVFQSVYESTDSRDVDSGVKRVTDFYWEFKDTISRNALWRVICVDLPLFCFQRKVNNTETVASVLRCIYDMEGFFGNCMGLFLLGVFPTPSSYISSGRKADYDNRALKYVSYFIRHINCMRLTFDDLRFSDLINLGSVDEEFVEIILYTQPELILLLARNGAWDYSDLPNCFGAEMFFFYQALQFVVKIGARFNQWSRQNLELKTAQGNLQRDVLQTCDVFLVLTKCVSNPHVLTLKALQIASQDPREPRPEDYMKFFDAVFPRDNLGQPIPASLKHICRHAIRSKLRENWQLPDGVYNLGLPKNLCEYINLCM